jgi:hypothetical protein
MTRGGKCCFLVEPVYSLTLDAVQTSTIAIIEMLGLYWKRTAGDNRQALRL